jgi:tetratricopeptide (TPR) repeat protein
MPSRRRRRSKTRQIRPESQGTLEKLIQPAIDYLEDRQPKLAQEVLEKIPARHHRHPEYLYLRSSANLQLENFIQAISDLEVVHNLSPDNDSVLLSLAMAYAGLEYWAHALRFATQFSGHSPDQPGNKKIARKIIDLSKSELERKSAMIGAPSKLFIKAGLPHETSLRYMNNGEFERAISEINAAVSLLPEWASPRNNRALSWFHLGKVEEAIDEEQAVLENLDQCNVHALANLILFYFSLWQQDQLDQTATRLRQLILESSLEEVDLEKAIEAFGIIEDDETLWHIASQVVDSPKDTLTGMSWYTLGAAAANTQHYPEALSLFKRAQQRRSETFGEWVDFSLRSVKKAKRSKKTAIGPALNGRFPYTHFSQLCNAYQFQELVNDVVSVKDPQLINTTIKKHIRKYPQIAAAFCIILKNETKEDLIRVALEVLSATEHSQAYREMLAYATSQNGSDELRMDALMKLREKGYLTHDQKTSFWDSKEQIWREVKLFTTRIQDSYTPPCHPKAIRLIDRSNQILNQKKYVKDREKRAVEYLQQALEVDPNCSMALHNLGVLYIKEEQTEIGEDLVRQSLEADPNYLHGHATVASIELENDNHKKCKDHLDKIFSSPEVPAHVYAQALSIQVRLGLAENEIDEAKTAFDVLKEFAPEYPGLPDLEQILTYKKMGELFKIRWKETVLQYRRRQLRKPVSKDEKLAACLDRMAKDVLVNTSDTWDLPTKGRKAELVERLINALLDPQTLQWFVDNLLKEEERQALNWVLESNGVISWDQFLNYCGDDAVELPSWRYFDLETISGRLQMYGLLAVGSLDGKTVAIIPADMRPLLKDIFTSETS